MNPFLSVLQRLSVFVALAMTLVAVQTGLAGAQTRVDAHKDWAVFEAGEGGSKVCWIVSLPKDSTATRGGKRVSVNRGDIFLMIAVRPADSIKNEVSFTAGYPFKGGSEVELSVGSNKFTLFTDGENAWLSSAQEDDGVVARFRAGASARVQGVSSRGTTTVDNFSLQGFTAALDSAQKRCG